MDNECIIATCVYCILITVTVEQLGVLGIICLISMTLYVFHFLLDFSKNRFDRLPKEVVSFRSLVKLTCHHNNLRYIPEELCTLTELRKLDCR